MKGDSVKFIPAKDLKRLYSVFGHFYSVQLGRGRHVKCRSVLEITTKDAEPGDANTISQRKPDAVCIMMNPGSSRPLEGDEDGIRIHPVEVDGMPMDLVPAKPDTTQYQLMRLMTYCGWSHVRVVNLSDLRCSKSSEFFQQYRKLEEQDRYIAHSIFAVQRKLELATKLARRRNAPIIRAWGVHDKLAPLIERCVAGLPRSGAKHGLLKPGTLDRYLHPLPSLQKDKLLWVDKMVARYR